MGGKAISLIDDDYVIFNNLCPGTYTVTVYDVNQCGATETYEVGATGELISNLEFEQYGEFACVDPEGGTPPYTVEWHDVTGCFVGDSAQKQRGVRVSWRDNGFIAVCNAQQLITRRECQ